MKGVKRMKKFGKFIATLAGVGAVCAGAYYFVKKVLLKDSYEDLDLDDDDDDLDDELFDDISDDDSEEIEVPVNMEEIKPDAEDDEEASYEEPEE